MNRFFYGIALLIFSINAHAVVHVNGKNINELTKGNTLGLEMPAPATNITLWIAQGNLEVGSLTFDERDLQAGIAACKEFEMQKEQLSCMNAGKSLNLGATKGSNKHDGVYLKAGTEICLRAGTDIDVNYSILESPEIYVIGTQMKFDHCLCKNTKFLQLESTSDKALFKIIRFTFKEDAAMPYAVQGCINLETGEIAENFMVMGACRVEIVFNDVAFQ